MPQFHLETVEGLSRLTFDNPPVNVLTTAMLEEMADALGYLYEHPTRALLISGKGRAFSAGMDVAEHAASKVEAMLAAAHRFLKVLWNLPCPVVAAVHGAVRGGGFEVALACDAVLATDDTTFGLPEVRVGAFPPFAAVLLPRRLAWPLAFELVACGRILSSSEARVCGLVNSVFTAEEFDDGVASWLRGLNDLSAPIVRQAKKALRMVHGDDLFADMVIAETQYRQELMELKDAREGVRAFLEKRAPQWKDA